MAGAIIKLESTGYWTAFTFAFRAGFSFFQLVNQLANCQLALTGGLSLDALFNSSVT